MEDIKLLVLHTVLEDKEQNGDKEEMVLDQQTCISSLTVR